MPNCTMVLDPATIEKIGHAIIMGGGGPDGEDAFAKSLVGPLPVFPC